MRTLIAILCFLFVACKDEGESRQTLTKAWTTYSLDSFELEKQNASLNVFVNQASDSFKLICKKGNFTILEVTLKQPPAEVKAKNIVSDSLPEIIIDDCLGCDLGRIRLFAFNRVKQQYAELKGTDSLLSEIYKLEGTDLIYNVACFNQGGCESTLLKVVGDSCISIGKMYVPYDQEPVQLTRSLNQSIESIPKPGGLNVDSFVPYLWKEHFLKYKSQQR